MEVSKSKCGNEWVVLHAGAVRCRTDDKEAADDYAARMTGVVDLQSAVRDLIEAAWDGSPRIMADPEVDGFCVARDSHRPQVEVVICHDDTPEGRAEAKRIQVLVGLAPKLLDHVLEDLSAFGLALADGDEEINGGDAVEWLGGHVESGTKLLQEAVGLPATGLHEQLEEAETA